MYVKVLIKRTVPIEKAREVLILFRQLRALAIAQPGYISGETLESCDQPDVYLVISTWRSDANWEKWLLCQERQEIQTEIDVLLGGKTTYEMFHYGFSE